MRPHMLTNGMTRSETLGLRLGDIRRNLGLSLREVSLRSGIPVSTLSKVQNHQTTLNYEGLVKLSLGLGVDIGEFFRSDSASLRVTRRAVNRRGTGDRGTTERYDYEILATELAAKRLVPGILTVTATSLEQVGGLSRHDGEEFVFVLEGSVELHTEFYAPVKLGEGDSAYIDSTMGHAYVRHAGDAGDRPARVLAVCSHGTFPPDDASA
jgi:transcriptional regulator with XRE-family HTH domain